MESEEQILEYELIDICIDCGYEQPAPNVPFVENELKLKVKNKRKKRSK